MYDIVIIWMLKAGHFVGICLGFCQMQAALHIFSNGFSYQIIVSYVDILCVKPKK